MRPTHEGPDRVQRMGNAMMPRKARGIQATYLLVIVIVAVLIANCSGSGGDSDSEAEGETQTELAGRSWSLSLLRGDGLLLQSIITADFGDDGTVSGVAGCNGYSASYETDGDQITFSTPETTSSTCRDRLMNQEAAYLETLQTIKSFGVRNTTMEMRDSQDRAMLVYDTLAQTRLPGSTWTLVEYADGSGKIVPVIEGSNVTADFGDSGLLSGSAGCNGYSANYAIASKLITIDTVVMTEIYCMEPEGLMDQEMSYLSALEGSAAYVIVEKVLGLLDEDGSVLAIFSADPKVTQ